MPQAAAAKLGVVRTLIQAAPDAALRSLEAALAGADGETMAQIRGYIASERDERSFRAGVLSPLAPLFQPRADGVSAPILPSHTLGKIWSELKARQPSLVEDAASARAARGPDDPVPREYDMLCAKAAALLRDDAAAGWPGLDRARADDLAGWFDLAPLGRALVQRLPEFIARPTEERIASLRLLFRDAGAVALDGAQRLMEVALAHLGEAHLVLRLIASLTDKAGDRFLAGSELASFGARLLDDVDRRIGLIEGFDPAAGAGAARAVSRHLQLACATLGEFDQSIELSRDGPWGSRVTSARRKLAMAMEQRLRGVEPAVSQALPLQTVRIAGRMTRPAPKLSADPDASVIERARALLVLLSEARASAAVGGYGALRNQAAEKIAERLDVYADEVLHLINIGEAPDEQRARDYLEIAAEFIGMARDDKAAQIIRRRAAVAGERGPSQDVA